jgi:hypothetical protein
MVPGNLHCAKSFEIYRRLRGVPELRFIVEILKLNGAGPPRALHSFAQASSSIHMVRETMRAVVKSAEWPPDANGFRILSDKGAELYRWPEGNSV